MEYDNFQVKKTEADRLERITVDMFPKGGPNYGKMVFNSGLIVNYESMIFGYERHIVLNYVQNSNDVEKITQHINLRGTRCYFGGTRYWFTCPGGGINGYSCGLRVRTLYMLNGVFCCRHCHDLTYTLKNLNYGSKRHEIVSFSKLLEKISKLNASIKRNTYNNKRTRKFVRLGNIFAKYQNLKSKILGEQSIN